MPSQLDHESQLHTFNLVSNSMRMEHYLYTMVNVNMEEIGTTVKQENKIIRKWPDLERKYPLDFDKFSVERENREQKY